MFSLYLVCCMSIVCSSVFLFGRKWLIIEPKSSQSALKTIYQVLKFAAKHKAPLNRSALTYWEEDIPSRLDLGKSRYGGPFTTEQVEDVKTFFKILIVLLPVFLSFVLSPTFSNFPSIIISGLSKYSSMLVYSFSYSPWFWVMATSFFNEFVIYPLFKNKLPTILTSIGIASLFVLLVQFGYLIVSVVEYVHPLGGILWQWPQIVSCVMFGCIAQFMLTKLFEFVCAQSPYHMRGLLTGYVVFVYISALAAGNLLQKDVLCHNSLILCHLIRNATAAALSLIGFNIYCLLARWYKMRVRDEAYNVHQVVEEIYDRYLSQQKVLHS